VFPGGRIDAADGAPGWDRLADLGEADAARLLGVREGGEVTPRAYLIGGVREVFEETGVLLGVDGAELPDPQWLQATRNLVHSAEETFATVLQQAGLRLNLGDLVPFARWVTPEAMPKRYDTFFLAAAMPPGQEAVAASGEIASLEWVSPQAALARADSAKGYTMPPTRAALNALAPFADVTSALAGLRRAANLDPILPRVVSPGHGPNREGRRVLLPGQPGYDEAR
jgi:8-oxo-dGTP pyrophosphatase MutT (NUDIX family)